MNIKPSYLFLLISCSALLSCSINNHYSPAKKYPKKVLQEDYLLMQHILEEKHPSLYWYTPKDSMDFYFKNYYNAISDSMTELQFAWKILAPTVDKIHCGHTSVGMSKAYRKWAENKRFPSFPLFMKIWNDTMAVTANLDRKDSIFKRGTIVTSINGIRSKDIIDNMFDYLPEDGYANNVNYIRLSSNFPYFHRNIYGLSKTYKVTYIDSAGKEQRDTLALYTAPKDSVKKDSLAKIEKKNLPKEKKLLQYRSLQIDSSGKFAIMTLNTFSNGKLRSFFRRSFRELRKKKINNLVIDIRSNGGGRVNLSTLLTRYVTRKKFGVADTSFAKCRTLAPYARYIKGKFFNNIEMFFISGKAADGLYHMKYMERKRYKPKKANGYKGDVYVLTNGPTFSAAALFCNAVKGQPGITLIGEETGGGWYGNNGIMIPDMVLPHTKLHVRLPLYRIVQYNHVTTKGTGVIPDILVPTSYEALLKGYDKKIQLVTDLIMSKTN